MVKKNKRKKIKTEKKKRKEKEKKKRWGKYRKFICRFSVARVPQFWANTLLV